MHLHSRFAVQMASLVVLASLCLAADKKQLSDAFAAVDANLKTTVGKQYDEEIGKEFLSKYLASIKQCKQSASGTSMDSFDILQKLNRGGKVEEILVYPETPIATCTRDTLVTGAFSPPPHDHYWVNIHMQLKH